MKLQVDEEEDGALEEDQQKEDQKVSPNVFISFELVSNASV